MRCVARYEVDLTGHSIYFDELPWCPSKGYSISLIDIVEETHKCPVGKVPIDSCKSSSSNQSLLGKACLFSVKTFTLMERILKRSDEAGRCLKKSKEP